MRAVILCLALAGCATLQTTQGLALCAATDVATTVGGVHAGLIKEANPIWAHSVNAGHYAPFVLAVIGMVLFLDWLDRPEVTGVVAGVECAFGAHNLWLMR